MEVMICFAKNSTYFCYRKTHSITDFFFSHTFGNSSSNDILSTALLSSAPTSLKKPMHKLVQGKLKSWPSRNAHRLSASSQFSGAGSQLSCRFRLSFTAIHSLCTSAHCPLPPEKNHEVTAMREGRCSSHWPLSICLAVCKQRRAGELKTEAILMPLSSRASPGKQQWEMCPLHQCSRPRGQLRRAAYYLWQESFYVAPWFPPPVYAPPTIVPDVWMETVIKISWHGPQGEAGFSMFLQLTTVWLGKPMKPPDSRFEFLNS